jgi:predicted transcriptional regulator
MIALSLKIPEELDAALQAASRARGMSKSALVREALEQSLGRQAEAAGVAERWLAQWRGSLLATPPAREAATAKALACLIERQQSKAAARDFLRGLLTWADVAPTQRTDAQQALDWAMPDYEDALQAAAALACGAQVIVTRNVRDFKGSSVQALTPEAFVAAHMH